MTSKLLTTVPDLRQYGYAPRDYSKGPCHSCGVRMTDVDKRAWRCRSCAEKLYDYAVNLRAEDAGSGA